MKESEIKYFTVSMLFRGRKEWVHYRIPHPQWERLRELFAGPRFRDLHELDYVMFRTSDRRCVLFDTLSVVAIRFLWDVLALEVPDGEEPEESDAIHLYFRDRQEPLEISPEDNADTFPFIQEIENDAGTKRPFVEIVDEDGELVVVNAAEVYLVEYPANAEGVTWERVEEDMRKAAEQRGETGENDGDGDKPSDPRDLPF